jgi:PRTRC genetic system protein C
MPDTATVKVTELKRIFVCKGEEFADPAPNQPPEKALEILALTNPELNNAVVEPPEAKYGKLVYNLKVNIGTKG